MNAKRTKNAATFAVRTEDVFKSFTDGVAATPVLRGTQFEARLGEMMLLVGPSGCGKTTLLSIIAGTLRADSGIVEVMGQRIDQMRSSAITAFRSTHLGFIFQQFNLIPTISIAENVSVPLLIAGWSPRKAEAKARELLGRVGLGGSRSHAAGKIVRRPAAARGDRSGARARSATDFVRRTHQRTRQRERPAGDGNPSGDRRRSGAVRNHRHAR
ncbi:MAG: ATP-binding cassette domain-containing protein [Tepidisphaeraceae bacterium]